MISKIGAHFRVTTIAKWVQVTTSNYGEAAVVTAGQNQNQKQPRIDVSSFFSPFMKLNESSKLLTDQ
jgi:hypothetical protein